jgi:hypothetical protein
MKNLTFDTSEDKEGTFFRKRFKDQHGNFLREDKPKGYMEGDVGRYLQREYGIKYLNKNFKCVSGNHDDKRPSMSYIKRGDFSYCHACRFYINAWTIRDQYKEFKK